MVRIAMSSGFVFYVKNASWFSVQTECDAMGKLCLIICTGCSLNIVFYSRILNIPDSCLSLFSLGVSVCIHSRQVEHQRCSRNGRVQNNHKILRKNTIFNEHPVCN